VNDDTGFIPVVRRWWWLLLLGMLGAAVAANVVARQEKPTYASSATLLVGPLNADYGTTQAAGDLGRTYAELAKTFPVLTYAARRAHVAIAPVDLAKKVTSTSNDVTRLVTVKVEESKPALASSLANAIGAQLIAVSRAVTPQETDSVRSFMSQPEISRLPVAARNAVQAAAVRIFGAGAGGTLRVVAPAVPSNVTVAPNIPLLTTLGALAGLALAAVAALLATVGRRQEAADVHSTNGVPFLGTVTGNGSAADAGYRLLAVKIGLFGDRRPKTVAILGAGDDDSAGAVAANLAAVLADGGVRALVVDAGSGSVTRLLELDGRPGYADLVRDPATVLDELSVERCDALRVVPAGENGRPSLLESERASRLLGAFRASADVVLLSPPPTRRSPVGLVWAGLAEATILIGGRGEPRAREAVEEAVESLALVGAHVVGTVSYRGEGLRIRWPLPRREKAVMAA
jgi:capsular polysaccharide biosynthesis protein